MSKQKIPPLLRLAFIAVVVQMVAMPALFAGDGKIRRVKNSVKNEYIVILKDDVTNIRGLANALSRKHEAELVQTWEHAVRGFHVRVPEGRAIALSHDPRVAWVEENAEMFPSSTRSTWRDPACTSNCPETSDNRLWHLGRVDGSLPDPVSNKNYNYCSTGDDVYIYIVDSGVQRSHTELGTRVLDGYNASGDPYPAHQPCGADIAPRNSTLESERSWWEKERSDGGHGTSVASIAAGKNVGVATDAWIVPVKVMRCDMLEGREWKANTAFEVGDRRINGQTTSHHWVVTSAGVSGSAPPTWDNTYGDTTNDGSVVWTTVDPPKRLTTAAAVAGLDWIVGPGNPNPTQPAVVNFSFWLDTSVESEKVSFEVAVESLLDEGMIVVAAAHNFGQDACSYSPTRYSRDNPTEALRGRVISVGGSMLLNNPEATSDKIPSVFRGDAGMDPPEYEPAWQSGVPTKDARWICGPGDSVKCVGGTTASNWGPCVTMFAPAKNITAAILPNDTSYRQRLGSYFDTPRAQASGTSFSAPIVAGIAALFLQHAPLATVDDVYAALTLSGVRDAMEDSVAYPLTGDALKPSPNLLARAVGVYAFSTGTAHSVVENGTATLNFSASGPPPLTYQWYRGTPGNPGASTLVATTSSGTVDVVPPSTGTYWVRVTSSGCSNLVNFVDSTAFDVTVTAPTVTAPSIVTATTTSTSAAVLVSWDAATDAVAYVVERSATYGGTYTVVADDVSGLSFTDAPPVAASPATYVYRVRGKDSVGNLSDPSGVDYATVKSSALFVDDPLDTNVVPVSPAHRTQLREAVNAVRTAAGLGVLTFNSEIAVDAAELNVLRAGLDEARAVMQLLDYPYTETITSGGLLRALHFNEMRASVK